MASTWEGPHLLMVSKYDVHARSVQQARSAAVAVHALPTRTAKSIAM